MIYFKMPLQFRLWRYFNPSILLRRIFQKKVRYSIHQIDNKENRFIMSEYGISFFLNFTELNEYLWILRDLSKYNILLYSFFLGRYCTLDASNWYLESNNKSYHEPTLILEAEDRAGQFKLYDFCKRKVWLMSFSTLMKNINFIEKMSESDLFFIGLSAGKNKRNIFIGLE